MAEFSDPGAAACACVAATGAFPALAVQSRRKAVRIGYKATRFLLPARTDELVGSETGESLETLGKVVGIQEGGQMLAYLAMSTAQLDREVRKGALPSINIDSHPRFSVPDIQAYIESRRVTGRPVRRRTPKKGAGNKP